MTIERVRRNNRWEVSGIPDGESGRFSIMSCTPETGPPSWQNYANFADLPDQTYTVLFEDFGSKLNIMQDSHREFDEHIWMLDRMKGDVLIGGLGIGMINIPLLESDEVTSVTIIEKNQDVIDLVWDHCAKDGRFTLVHDDVNTWNIPEGNSWDVAWFDTWLTHEEPLQTYIDRIREKYGDYATEINGWNWPE